MKTIETTTIEVNHCGLPTVTYKFIDKSIDQKFSDEWIDIVLPLDLTNVTILSLCDNIIIVRDNNNGMVRHFKDTTEGLFEYVPEQDGIKEVLRIAYTFDTIDDYITDDLSNFTETKLPDGHVQWTHDRSNGGKLQLTEYSFGIVVEEL